MKKVKQILAIIGIVLLVAMYLLTLIFAITDNSDTMRVFQASVVATVLIPVLIWAYTFVYRLSKGSGDADSENGTADKEDGEPEDSESEDDASDSSDS